MAQGVTAALEKGLCCPLVSNVETYMKSLALCHSDC